MYKNNTTRYVDQHLLTAIPTFSPDARAREVVSHLTDKKHNFESITYIYILEAKKLVGVISVKEILRAHAETKLSELMTKKLVAVHPHATAERAAITAIQHGIKAVPVTDRQGNFLGIVGTDTILRTLHHEHVEDLLKIGGIQIVEQKHILEMLGDKVSHLLRIRTPWLILGLGGGFIATLVASFFEHAIAQEIALAFFIPVIVYMSDAVGTQTQTLFIRALAVRKISLPRYLLKELAVDIALGLLLGIIIAGFGFVWGKGGVTVAAIVGIAMAINVVIAGAVAILISWILYYYKRDPAVGAGPFATVVQDILSLIVYFSVASLLL
ncbi:hypothetical protein A3B21_00735 [Candidatus Uhrbacteria bacterium RIFCSPLOWO2_01_FULL_47_24]|uniref:CBS domain-containing protein n=1 Tax=Candidatus Uhrbacteria bacterium RIFCSPLOWO2_01_FULL_47_24 TaxID=1802401 RepID=A0A1F7UNQ7_9BACT|nr:MAG: hypothetical protein A2753_01370 [Candidatus Uhrbacteria bacterium RIFCSPHIGHO2_01_FULL_47_11]OGL67697.1 MAG: hypothetical protein A3D58_04625 [Candidatus Uhrbacteria bacterium RIFCSPHIGHO2_02_FULL_46_47]OGL79902.1 MAG: hypothetical protein A3B21_00735 [Candidatus Uhrbacteria bacterium RIFCSPLOWO2_01_FULL_47_24]OGL84122.1 MAG: hypothetical protein A3J03_03530 [Candidatus Uhrbacteria bacterium RIFCSPLOWO2_02_FULL_46_25]OGL93521.1 MAG: hypothetical protein A3H11_03885 [Candidatus Uhrbacte